jgi:hypothetical protein
MKPSSFLISVKLINDSTLWFEGYKGKNDEFSKTNPDLFSINQMIWLELHHRHPRTFEIYNKNERREHFGIKCYDLHEKPEIVSLLERRHYYLEVPEVYQKYPNKYLMLYECELRFELIRPSFF